MRRNRGIHWSKAPNKRLVELARDRAWEFDPQMEDPEMEHDGIIDCYFGSSGYSITLRSIDSESCGAFMYGYCSMLALALHRKTGLALVTMDVEGSTDDWTGHAFVEVEPGKYLDINGFTSEDDIRSYFRGETLSAPKRLSEKEFAEKVVSDKEFLSDPLGFFDELERLVVEDFADYLIETYLPKN